MIEEEEDLEEYYFGYELINRSKMVKGNLYAVDFFHHLEEDNIKANYTAKEIADAINKSINENIKTERE